LDVFWDFQFASPVGNQGETAVILNRPPGAAPPALEDEYEYEGEDKLRFRDFFLCPTLVSCSSLRPLFNSVTNHHMGSLKKRRKAKIAKHKRKKRMKENRHKKRLRYKS
jgi:hypothetical protein